MNTLRKRHINLIPAKLSIVFFIILFYLTMRGYHNQVEYFLMLALFFTILFLCAISDLTIVMEKLRSTYLLVLVLYLFIVTIYSLISGVDLYSSLGYTLSYFFLFYGVIILKLYTGFFSYKTLQRLFVIIMLIWLYFSIKAIIIYIENPFLAREIISSNDSIYSSYSIGNPYALAFGSSLLAVFIFGILISKCLHKKSYKALLTVVAVILIYLIYLTGSTITLLATFIGIFFNFLIYKFKQKSLYRYVNIAFITITTIILIIVLLLFIENIISFFNNLSYSNNSIIFSRIALLLESIYKGNFSGTIEVRNTLYLKSLEVFLENPFFGAGFKYGLGMVVELGNHSEAFDNLASFGVFISPLYFYLLLMPIKEIKKITNDRLPSGYILTLLILIVFNPFHYHQSNMAFMFIIPVLAFILVGGNSNNQFKKIQSQNQYNSDKLSGQRNL